VNVRPIALSDYQAIVDLMIEDEEQLFGQASPLTVNDLREWLSRNERETDSWLYEDAGKLCAVGWCDAAPGGEVAVGIGIVRPGWKGKGIGSELVTRSEAAAARHGISRIHQFAMGADDGGRALFLARGYRDVRHFFSMAIELTERPDPPRFDIDFVTEHDVRAFHDALDEAFRDHWEHHSTPFEEWWERHGANPNLDLSLWFLIRDGDEIAAVARNEANRNGGGYVGALGVRRPWRGKGYAKALLLHAFREFYDRGLRRVTLGVDAENPTGATHLYERVGMHVEQEQVVFEKSFT
jgi:GNAT superfamily N-acetyltransferase